ncbi:hypothetical protein QEG98_34170 [Myxococcus sp. MxC21-1]|uniref:hypothetical protein n=1 Tax=Myxococcus sp. MxC21-1 TaxID=3041439 RepID=UPI002930F78F|nr:hypothetical protein [Myxococcus sp. MxC21-1]WNZ60922.1 hypothetical protein QEG98_34170 [Myxococcus sp. MxC21-1]
MVAGDHGFQDVDGFAEDDLYVAGGPGELWHLDGVTWRRLALPTNETVRRVCCAHDGEVYVLAGSRQLLVGRRSDWRHLEPRAAEEAFESIVAYGDRVILSTQSALFEVADGAISPAALGSMSTLRNCSFLAAGHGILLVAGAHSASSFDGTTWTEIFGP